MSGEMFLVGLNGMATDMTDKSGGGGGGRWTQRGEGDPKSNNSSGF